MHRALIAVVALSWLTQDGIAQDFQFMPFATRARASLLPVPAGWTGYAVTEDMNGDGSRDLVVSFNNTAAAVFTRSATGWVVPATAVIWLLQKPVLVDLDGDGDRDLVGVPPHLLLPVLRPLPVYANTPNGMTAVTMPWPAWTVFRGVAVGDIDADGFADMVVAMHVGSPPPSLALARGGPGLQFTLDTTSIPAGLPFALWPELLDVDGDGDLDLLATNATSGLRFLRNSGPSFVDATSSLPPMRSGHFWLMATDLDGDGHTDCAATLASGDVDVLWGAPGGPTFAAAVATVPGVLRLHPADLDGDLDLDLLAEHTGGLDVLWNQGNRQFARTSAVDQPTALCGVADVDFDGVTDIVFSASSDPAWLRWLSRTRYEDAAFRVGFEPWTGVAQSRALGVAGDVDGDGRTDFVTPGENQVTVDHALGGGAYRRSASPILGLLGALGWEGRSELADMDGDGDLDLVVKDSWNVVVGTNDGAGTFTVALQGTSLSTLNNDDLRLADLDGNGLRDILLADSRGTVLIKNRGGGQYDPPVVIVPTMQPHSRCVEVADVDGDGDLDVITDGFISPAQVIAVNDGMGNFAATLSVNLGMTPISVRAGDIDGDGDTDLLAAGSSGFLVALRNNGSGTFTDTTLLDLPPTGVAGIAGNPVFADLDDDGDLDASAMRLGPAPCLLLFNDGSGRFADVSAARATLALPTNFGIFRLRAADFDDDGDVDLIAGAHGYQGVVANHLRQCRSNAALRLGGVADLHLISGPSFGAPGLGLLGVGFGLAAPSLQLPGLAGQLQLDPATLQVMAAVPTSSIGVSSAFVPVPQDAVLFGLEVWFQGAIVPSVGRPGFTNAVYEVVLR